MIKACLRALNAHLRVNSKGNAQKSVSDNEATLRNAQDAEPKAELDNQAATKKVTDVTKMLMLNKKM